MLTVSLENLFCTLIFDAYEECKVTIFEVFGVYLGAEIIKDNRILLKIRMVFFDIMCQFNSDDEHKVRYENGGKVLYLLVLRNICVCIRSALMWYNLFSTSLESLNLK